MLLKVLQFTKKTANEMSVVKRLGELASKYPDKCVACLRLLVEGDRDRWLLVGVEQEAEKVITLALSSPSARISAISLVEEMIARGHYRFRRLLKS